MVQAKASGTTWGIAGWPNHTDGLKQEKKYCLDKILLEIQTVIYMDK